MTSNTQFMTSIFCKLTHRLYSISNNATISLKPLIGLEIHAKILTDKKLFSGIVIIYCHDSLNDIVDGFTEFSPEAPNTKIVPFDLAFPGTMPNINTECIIQGIKAGLAFNCTISRKCEFDRKHYFYHDIPLGYQITQYHNPIAFNGIIDCDPPVRVQCIQIEQDTAKTLDMNDGTLRIDFNRSGIGLLEIVTMTDLISSLHASNCLKTIQSLLRKFGISDGHMEQGSMRCDANVSIIQETSNGFKEWPRCEIKNVVSIHALRLAIDAEIHRQTCILESGQSIHQQTLSYDLGTKTLSLQREKESKLDYRYMNEPDLPIWSISTELVKSISLTMIDNNSESLLQQLQKDFQLSQEQVSKLKGIPYSDIYFQQMMNHLPIELTRQAIIWITIELVGQLNKRKLSLQESPIKPIHSSRLLKLLHVDQSITKAMARKVLVHMDNDIDQTIERYRPDTKEIIHQAELFIQQNMNQYDSDTLIYRIMKNFQGKINIHQIRELISRSRKQFDNSNN